MLVVGIIVVLAGMAIPSYKGYQNRVRQTEASVMLASLYNAQVAHQAQHSTFTPLLQGPGGVDWKPSGYKGGGAQESFYYTYGFNVNGAQEGIHYFTGKLGAPKEALRGTLANDKNFVAGAAAPGSVPGAYDLWLINQDKTITHIPEGSAP